MPDSIEDISTYEYYAAKHREYLMRYDGKIDSYFKDHYMPSYDTNPSSPDHLALLREKAIMEQSQYRVSLMGEQLRRAEEEVHWQRSQNHSLMEEIRQLKAKVEELNSYTRFEEMEI